MSNQSRDATSSGKSTGRLLGEFETQSYEQWRAAAEKSLKGAPFDKKLRTKTYEGLILDPVYTRERAEELPHVGTFPGLPPFVRGTRAAMHTQKPWDISQNFVYSNPKSLAEAIERDLESGLSVVGFSVDEAGRLGRDPDGVDPSCVGNDGVSIVDASDLEAILKAADVPEHPVQIDSGSAGLAVAAMVVASCRKRSIDLSRLEGGILMDPLGVLARFGQLPRSTNRLFEEMASLAQWAAQNAPHMHTVGVSTHCYHNSGANGVEELGFALATGAQYLHELLKRGLAAETVCPRILFSFSVGGNFFMEVAKLRAARLLWSQVVQAFGGNEESQKMNLRVRTSEWNKTVYDPYVNILRGTTETFSAAIAGADCIQTGPFDEPIGEPDEFSLRIARNVQIILQEESNLHRVIDPVGGSWYVETLTDYLASSAWKLFQDVEGQGGMAKALESGFPSKIIGETAAAKTKDLSTRKEVVIGTNIYPNPHEKPIVKNVTDVKTFASDRGNLAVLRRQQFEGEPRADLVEENFQNVMEDLVSLASRGATLGQLCKSVTPENEEAVKIEAPLSVGRRAEMFEKMRRAALTHFESTGKRTTVFLANMGPIPKHKARADFSAGFFEVAGMEILTNSGFDTPEEAAEAAIESGADAAVVCSTDDSYPEIVPHFVSKVREKNSQMTLILAGYPADQVEAHRKSGIQEFIHIKADNYEILRSLLQKTGVAL